MRKIIGILSVILLISGGIFLTNQYSVDAAVENQNFSPIRNQVRASHILLNTEPEAKKL